MPSPNLPAVSPNRIMAQVGRYLDTLGSWHSYRDLTRPEELPHRLADITAAFFGVSGLDERGRPHLTGILGAMMAVHALEQVTGSVVTLGFRWLGRGQPLGRYRGVTWRASPLTPRTARALTWLIGGRLVEAAGFYFFEAGRTWHSQTFTVQVWQSHKTLTHLRSFSLPYRTYYFDRDVPPPTLIDLVKGDHHPPVLPGFIGTINELEQVTLLAPIKRAFFAAHWLLVEPEERDEGGPGFVDGPWPGGHSPDRGDGAGRFDPAWPRSPLAGPGRSRSKTASNHRPAGPTTAVPTVVSPAGASPGSGAADKGRPQPLYLSPRRPTSAAPHERIQDLYQGPDGRQHPLLIRGLITHPITMLKKADAIYYDAGTHRWQEITDDAVRIALAQQVEAGQRRVTPDWRRYL